MIRRLRHNEIDFDKYDECIAKSVQKNFYAQKEILDFLCESWDVLVWEDYAAVMPVPLKKKYGFRFVVMPLFCQQLGVFSIIDQQARNEKFLRFFKRSYRIINYSFNCHNDLNGKLKFRKDYFIGKTAYEPLYKSYSKGRKSSVKSAQFHGYGQLKLEDSVLLFIRNNFKGLDKSSDLELFMKYLYFLDNRNQLRLFGSTNKGRLTNVALIIEQEDTLSLLGLVNDENAKADNGASFLIDQILKENIPHKNFDFMGGNIRGIALFFRSFGAELKQYPFLLNYEKVLRRFFH